MLTLKIPRMSCGGCASSIEKAVKGADPAAQVTVDLAARTVAVATTADPSRITAAIKAAGYDAAAV